MSNLYRFIIFFFSMRVKFQDGEERSAYKHIIVNSEVSHLGYNYNNFLGRHRPHNHIKCLRVNTVEPEKRNRTVLFSELHLPNSIITFLWSINLWYCLLSHLKKHKCSLCVVYACVIFNISKTKQ